MTQNSLKRILGTFFFFVRTAEVAGCHRSLRRAYGEPTESPRKSPDVADVTIRSFSVSKETQSLIRPSCPSVTTIVPGLTKQSVAELADAVKSLPEVSLMPADALLASISKLENKKANAGWAGGL